MGTISLSDLGKTRKLHQGLPVQEERKKFSQEVVVGKDGVYLSYLSDFFDIVYRTEKFDGRTKELLQGVGVPDVSPGLTIAEKIPSGMIYRMVAWYRHVEELYGTEATMQVFYDKTGGTKDFPQDMLDKYQGAVKRDGKFVYVIPEQNVTGGHVTFDGDQFPTQLTKELYDWAISNYEPVLNIHSHNSMNAFWSGEDDKNELPLYNRLCLVVGRVNTDHPTFRFSWNFEGKRHHYEDKIDTFIQPLEIKTTINGLDYEVSEEMGFKDALGYIDFDKLEFDERWDDRIKARGRYGKHFNQFQTLAELDKKDYTMMATELATAKDLAVNGDYEEGVVPDLELFDHLAEGNDLEEGELSQEDLEQNEFYNGSRGMALDESEEESTFSETWKQDLAGHKEKMKSQVPESGVLGDANSFRRNYQGGVGKTSGKSKGVYEKFKKDQLRNEKHKGKQSQGFGQTNVWDDLGGKY